MNKLYIVALLMIVAGIIIISNMTKDITQYNDFASAANVEGDVKIIGTLDKSMPLEYNPELKPNEFIFHLKDGSGVSKKVILTKPKPMEFENVEQIVLTGQLKNDAFVASEMLTKCPSKYKNEEIYIKS